MKAALAIALALACGGRKETPAADKEKPVAEKADEGRWVVVEQHGDAAAAASYVAMDLAAASPSPISLGEAPALPDTGWQGHFRTVAAHAGARWVRAQAKGGGFSLVVGDARGGAPRSIDVDGEPTALHLHGDALLVGLGQRLGWIDLAAAHPRFQEITARDHEYKSYDLFAASGDRVVAVDDVVMPMVADWLSLEGKPPHRIADWNLPGVINGHYTHAALRARDKSFTLYLLAPYGIMDGSGHDLVAVPVEADKLVFDKELTLQNGRNGPTPVIEEHVDRGTGKAIELVAGSEVTDWTGLVIDPEDGRILIAAGKRGLLLLPADFKSDTRGVLVDLGGECRDVAVRGGAPIALVASGEASDLVELTRGGGTYAAGARHRLPAAFDRVLP